VKRFSSIKKLLVIAGCAAQRRVRRTPCKRTPLSKQRNKHLQTMQSRDAGGGTEVGGLPHAVDPGQRNFQVVETTAWLPRAWRWNKEDFFDA